MGPCFHIVKGGVGYAGFSFIKQYGDFALGSQKLPAVSGQNYFCIDSQVDKGIFCETIKTCPNMKLNHKLWPKLQLPKATSTPDYLQLLYLYHSRLSNAAKIVKISRKLKNQLRIS